MQERDGGRAAHPVALRHLVAADAVLRGAVEVVVALEPGLDRRLDPSVRHRVVRAALADGQRPAGAVVLALAALVVLAPLEVGEDLVVGPAGAPAVVVHAVAADVDHRVDRRRTTERLAARHVHHPVVAAGLGERRVVPVHVGLEERAERGRYVDQLLLVRRPRLDQEDRDVRVLAQTRGEHAARRPCSDDDVVVSVHGTDQTTGPRGCQMAATASSIGTSPGPRSNVLPTEPGS